MTIHDAMFRMTALMSELRTAPTQETIDGFVDVLLAEGTLPALMPDTVNEAVGFTVVLQLHDETLLKAVTRPRASSCH